MNAYVVLMCEHLYRMVDASKDCIDAVMADMHHNLPRALSSLRGQLESTLPIMQLLLPVLLLRCCLSNRSTNIVAVVIVVQQMVVVSMCPKLQASMPLMLPTLQLMLPLVLLRCCFAATRSAAFAALSIAVLTTVFSSE